MTPRTSSYPRIPNDVYITPRWVYEALYSVEPWARDAWDCAPVNSDFDFLADVWNRGPIATNPPYGLAPQFCRHALVCADRVAMLLSIHFDAAKGRRDLFADNPAFKARYAFTKRIRWENVMQKQAGPRSNHCWYVWDRSHVGPPIMGWL